MEAAAQTRVVGRAEAADLCHWPTCRVRHSITASDLLPGEGRQVKPPTSAAAQSSSGL